MSYPIEVRLASKNGWHTPAEAKKHYGRYSRDGVTIHWWNDPSLVKDSDHDNICNYILGKAQRGTGSVNYVISNNKITMLVNPDNVAWASQGGNPTTVSIECSPHLNSEGYKKVGWVINELFNPVDGRYRRKPGMWQHKDWWKTVCSGTVSKERAGQEAAKWAGGYYDPKPQPEPLPPTKPEDPIIGEWILWKETEEIYVCNKQPTHLYDLSEAVNWNTVKVAKSFNKGDKITIAGSFKNLRLNRTYYVTRYSFDRKLATGFHPDDLDVYVEPNRPIPEPPKPPQVPPEVTQPEIPDTPEEPEQPETPEYPNWFINFWMKLIESIKNILNRKG